MKAEHFCELARRLMRHPAAPYHEAAVRAEAEQICAENKLPFKQDPFGNLLVWLQTTSSVRPLALAAHLDHPGFEIARKLSSGWQSRFLGGVPSYYFRSGTPLRIMPGQVPAVLGKPVGKDFQVRPLRPGRHTNERVPAPLRHSAVARFAVWELEDFAVRRDRIYGRACDDLIGVAAILATLIDLKMRRARVNVIGVISRAEEIGFQGALTVAAGKTLPAESLIISLETSREIPPVKMGRGMILRVGDRTSIFDSDGTRFLAEVAQGIAARDKSFLFQRALMSGGSCEATAFQEFGFQTAAVCIALGNYHNCGPRGRIAPEFVNISDALGMVRLLTEAALKMPNYRKLISKLPKRLNVLLKIARKKLLRRG